jgi:hypothetical protein
MDAKTNTEKLIAVVEQREARGYGQGWRECIYLALVPAALAQVAVHVGQRYNMRQNARNWVRHTLYKSATARHRELMALGAQLSAEVNAGRMDFGAAKQQFYGA